MNNLKIIKKFKDEKHPSVKVEGEEFSLSVIGNPKDIDELKRCADWAESIIEHYESIIKNDFVRREE